MKYARINRNAQHDITKLYKKNRIPRVRKVKSDILLDF